MNNPSLSQRPVVAGSVAGIARLVRQVCILREQGDTAGAVRLQETEVATAIRDHRLAHGPEALPDDELQALYAAEERRVADAAVLCELLIPRLSKVLPAAGFAPASGAGNRSVFRPPVLVVSTATASAGSPAIPDLLDAMLAAERTDRRPLAAGKHES